MSKLDKKPNRPGVWIDITTFDDLSKGELVELNSVTGDQRKSKHPLLGDDESEKK